MPIILATWEAEIMRIFVQGYPEQKVCKTTSQSIDGYYDILLPPQTIWEAKLGRIMCPDKSWPNSLQEPHLNRKKAAHGGLRLSS
jgi:hypothetical protein